MDGSGPLAAAPSPVDDTTAKLVVAEPGEPADASAVHVIASRWPAGSR
ncbi:hypothetical protein [Actinomadura rudentiformis]|nr:hypothetical protein [Actinomadura rudentiformis]